MTTNTAPFPNRQIWLIATIVAFALGVPFSFFSDSAPWLICIPIVVGTMIIGIAELKGVWQATQLPLIKMPRHFFGLNRYKGYSVIALPIEKEEPNQKLFDFLSTQRGTTKFPKVIKDEKGYDFIAVDAEQFIHMVSLKASPNFDKVAEAALIMAVHRYGEMHNISAELEQFIRDKTILETFKADFRGNSNTNLNRSAEAVIRELMKKALESKLEIPASKPLNR